ncbi:CPBP family intramembrane glutamic endopeptidase [Dyella kyungheensis]|uniref:CPBP family intramembrane metalloprotease n=1 Tax=Dyella kyungheensis TaxID=1242174 RepID=A0ABS2JUE3_9GAMM|nr:type II CAAX endopeptidase family protein [Dyella kyungheensis]MBM7121688.1 CPBP family intramembrane metalloprotease [Dyella kyungheensis]
MPAAQIAFITPATATPWQRWVVFSPMGRIVFFVALLIAMFKLTSVGISVTGLMAPGVSPLSHAIGNMLMRVVPALVAYTILVKAIERRRMQELSARDIPTLGMAGLLVGALMISTVVLVLWLAGSYHVSGTNPAVNWLPAVLTTGLGAGIAEEIITRGVLFRAVEEGLGTWWALAISALFFGAAHIFNPGATLWSSLAIAIEAGVLLALLYHVTRSLWPCIGLHAAWNVMQGTFFGIPVSGTEAHGWLISTRTGPDWLSGGVFGAEASVVALIVCSACSALLLIVALRHGTIVPPAWQRTTANRL